MSALIDEDGMLCSVMDMERKAADTFAKKLMQACWSSHLSNDQIHNVATAIIEYRDFYKNLYSDAVVDICGLILNKFITLVDEMDAYRSDYMQYGLPSNLNDLLDDAIKFLSGITLDDRLRSEKSGERSS